MIAWVAALGLLLPVQAAPTAPREESLAEKAARARKPAPARPPAAPARVFTNEDLANARGTVVVLPAPEGEETASGEAAAEPTAPPERTDEEYRVQAGAVLQKEIDRQAEIIAAGKKAIEEWERELNDLTNYTFGTRRAALMQSIDDARKAMADAQQSITDLEDQARRQGIRVTLP